MGYTKADTYTLVVESSLDDGSAYWRNSIDMGTLPGHGPVDPADPLVDAFVGMLKGAQRTGCSLVRKYLRNWVRGAGEAGHTTALWDIPLSEACSNFGGSAMYTTKVSSGTPAGGEPVIQLLKARAVGGGRKHFMTLRNSLAQDDLVLSDMKQPEFNPTFAAALIGQINTWVAAQLGSFYDTTLPVYYILVDASVKHSLAPTDAKIDSITFRRITMRDLTNTSKR